MPYVYLCSPRSPLRSCIDSQVSLGNAACTKRTCFAVPILFTPDNTCWLWIQTTPTCVVVFNGLPLLHRRCHTFYQKCKAMSLLLWPQPRSPFWGNEVYRLELAVNWKSTNWKCATRRHFVRDLALPFPAGKDIIIGAVLVTDSATCPWSFVPSSFMGGEGGELEQLSVATHSASFSYSGTTLESCRFRNDTAIQIISFLVRGIVLLGHLSMP